MRIPSIRIFTIIGQSDVQDTLGDGMGQRVGKERKRGIFAT